MTFYLAKSAFTQMQTQKNNANATMDITAPRDQQLA